MGILMLLFGFSEIMRGAGQESAPGDDRIVEKKDYTSFSSINSYHAAASIL